ncbi:MAG: TPM domain-containing protein [Spirochaetes bacterium]|nr:TPM domain-containing protein [Spirochaetota bacterium]
MRKSIVRLLALACLVALPLGALGLDVPVLKARVNDYANMLSHATVSSLEEKLADFERKESTQIAVLTIPSLQGEVIEEFSMKVAEKWKIGQKKLDNGVILLIAKEDRKLRIEVGYGLEGKLTDLRAGRIIDRIITPSFKAGDYDKGVTDGVNAIMETVRGEYSAVDARAAEKEGSDPSSMITPMIFVLFFIGIIGKIKRILGGIAGAVIIPIVALVVYGLKLFILFLVPGGFLIGLIMPSVMTLMMMMGFGGGGRSGGGSGGGGFSGGGGSFGGGGASGGW